jgi:carbonic anhydrase/acetyltransferase-like protein (isoleucine patch superfamily)
VNPKNKKNPYRFMQLHPQLGQRVYVAKEAHVSGAVTLADDVSIWPMAVLRGDVNRITIGARCNIQDNCVLHVTHEGPDTPEGGPLNLAEDITIGHSAVLHACSIGPRCLVGMGAIIMDSVELEADVMIAAGTVVTPGTRVAARTLWKGNPARLARELSEHEVSMLLYSAQHYVRLKDHYLAQAAGKGKIASGDLRC